MRRLKHTYLINAIKAALHAVCTNLQGRFATCCVCIALLLSQGMFAQKMLTCHAPDSNLQVILNFTDTLRWQLVYKGKPVVLQGTIGYTLGDGTTPGLRPVVSGKKESIIRQAVRVPVPYRQPELADHYRWVQLTMKGGWTLDMRLYNDGFAYRVLFNRNDSLTIVDELAQWDIGPKATLWYAHSDPRLDADRFHTSFEGQYRRMEPDTLQQAQPTYAPLLAKTAGGTHLLISDANLRHYAGMHIRMAADKLTAEFASYPATEKLTEGEFPAWVAVSRMPWIARVSGKAALPFRAFIVADSAVGITRSHMLYLLGDPSEIADASWIKAGKGTDEWICGINLFHVPFKAGINTDTYKYYIDFAQRFGFNQIMLDAGWSDYANLFSINPAIQMDTLLTYAKQKNVHLMLWTLSSTLDRQLDSILPVFERWGISHIMTDFMDRDDQKTVQFYERIAKACARHRIAVMFHGAYPPKGFNRTWPNAITQEGVLGAEWNIWSQLATPAHNVNLAFTRMAAGPLDYEPGLLLNAQPDQFRPVGKNPMSQGTRCHQLAMFVVYDSPLQIFSGNPSQGMLEPAFMAILGSLPTTWDETLYLQGEPDACVVVARRKGTHWYIAALNAAQPRIIDLPLSFLPPGKHTLKQVMDGINAASYGADYRMETTIGDSSTPLRIAMAPGGGYLGVIEVHTTAASRTH